MRNWETVVISLAAVQLLIVTLTTGFRLCNSLWKKLRHRSYHLVDEFDDGVPHETFRPGYKHWTQFMLICASYVVGMTLAVQSTVRAHINNVSMLEIIFNYLQLASWIFTFGIPLGLVIERDLVAHRTNLLSGFLSCVVKLPAPIVVVVSNDFYTARAVQILLPPEVSCRFQAIACAVMAMALLTIPRGPVLYVDDKEVDCRRTSSILSHISFAWFPQIFRAVAKDTQLKMDDMPLMTKNLRATTIFDMAPGGKSELVRTSLYRYRYQVLLQCILGLISEILGLGPEFFLFVLLKSLENPGKWSKYVNAWTAAICMGSLLTLRTCVDVSLYWLAWTRMELPVQAETIATVFAKAMRKKNSTGPPPKDDTSPRQNRLNVINLISTDAPKCSSAFSKIFDIPRELLKFSFAVIFLIFVVLGWRSVLLSMSTFAIVVPLNIWLTRVIVKRQRECRKASDVRLDASAEALQAARHIKLSGLEPLWIQRLVEARRIELQAIWRIKLLRLCQRLLFIFGPVVKDVVALGSYVYIYGTITPSVAFTASLVLARMDASLFQIPSLTTERLDTYLNSLDRTDTITKGEAVSLRNASLAWPNDSNSSKEAVLTNITLDFPRGDLSVISGPTGSGKSLLLESVLGEAEVISGSVVVPAVSRSADWITSGLMAYVPQTAWAENATIRDNILFGLPFVQDRYQKVTAGCCLDQDFAALTDGDLTEIGALGVTLSGGQRSRVALARALYSRAEILVLDDVLSAVDAEVGRKLLQTLSGELGRGRTRIMATHHVKKCLQVASFIVLLRDKSIFQAGSPQELRLAVDRFEDADKPEQPKLDSPEKPGEKPKTLIKEEQRAKGYVKRKVYYKYFAATGGILAWGAMLAGYSLHRTGQTWSSWWLKTWTESYKVASSNTLWYYISIYVAINASTCLVLLLEEVVTFLASLRASRVLFEEFVGTILYATLRWYDTVPVGRILNRLSADFSVIDSSLCHDIGSLFWLLLRIVFVIAIGTLASPYMLVAAALLFAACGYFAYYYIPTAREIRRILATARSPMYEQFGSALAGIETIRASGMEAVYRQRFFQLLDEYVRITYYQLAINRWLAFRLGMVGCVYTVLVTALIITLPSVDASLVGFVLSDIFRFDRTVRSVIRTYATVELNMNAAERIVEFFAVPIDSRDGMEPPAAWPTNGKVEIKDLQIKYAPELPVVLKGLSLSIPGGERLAVVGRTGAGKSSLALALFRVLEAHEGSIKIDGSDISKLYLSNFRRRLTIIPQDPVLFSGSVRSNLDPFSQHDDTELIAALQAVSTSVDASPNTSMPNSLDFEISEGGKSLSHGQRQLLCLARALILKTKIIIFDEATSAVDMETDTMIQKVIRKHFAGATIICIAHRLSTVIDFDQVAVLGDGKLVEKGSPRELFTKKGEFWNMVQNSGEKTELEKAMKS